LKGISTYETRRSITCNLFADHVPRQREIEEFWLDVAQLSERSLDKSYVKRVLKAQQEEANE
jgi:hypothetical protein